jgi:hypothetical protein
MYLYPIAPVFRVGLMPIATTGRSASGQLLNRLWQVICVSNVSQRISWEAARRERNGRDEGEWSC